MTFLGQDIFFTFIAELGKLGKDDTTESIYHVYLLEKLALVESFLIITDLEQAGEMVAQLFRFFFQTTNHPQLQNVYSSMVNIRTQLTESMDLNQDAVGLLLKYLANGDTVTAAQHAMVVEVYDANSFLFQKHVYQVMQERRSQVCR